MRFVADYIIAENSFKEFPHWQIRTEHDVTNQIAQLQNNYQTSLVPKLDSDDKHMTNEKGVYLYELSEKDAADGLKQEDFNAIDFRKFGDDAPTQIEKTLRFKRK